MVGVLVCVFSFFITGVARREDMDDTVRGGTLQSERYGRARASKGAVAAVAVILHLDPGFRLDGTCGRVHTAHPVIGVDHVLFGGTGVVGSYRFKVNAKTGDLGVGGGPRAADGIAAPGCGHSCDSGAVVVVDLLRSLGVIRQVSVVAEIPTQVCPVIGCNIVIATVDPVIDDADNHSRPGVAKPPGPRESRVDPAVHHLRGGPELNGIKADIRGRLVHEMPLTGKSGPHGGIVIEIGIVGIKGGELFPACGGEGAKSDHQDAQKSLTASTHMSLSYLIVYFMRG